MTPQVLPSYTEVAVFSEQQIQQAPQELQNELKDLKRGGYQDHNNRQARDGKYWWNPGLRETYYEVNKFSLPKTTQDSFGNQTTYDYDSHSLILVETTDALGNKVVAEDLNYEVLQPQKIIDINGNSSEVQFDPMGRVLVTSHYGTENNQSVGFDPLNNYSPQETASGDDVINNPQNYFKNVADYFYYDLFRWMGRVKQQDFSQLLLSNENRQQLWKQLVDKAYINNQGLVLKLSRMYLHPFRLPNTFSLDSAFNDSAVFFVQSHIPPLKCHTPIIFAFNEPETFAQQKFQAFIIEIISS